MRCVFVVVLLLLAGCGTVPRETRNACAVFEQRDNLFNNWRRAAYAAEREYGVPVPVLMATVYTESGFRHNAKPPRTKLLGFIPWTRISSAYGYSQALDGTWARYQAETGRWTARRSDFGDAIRFIAWYHNQSHKRNGIALNDTYRLYIAYYHGHSGYARGNWSATAKAGAKRASGMAAVYARQLRGCNS
ncbi:transglycosylase SLT domain-containing protein [Sinorhizobium medicae]|uniref:Transglycosylase SLT domain-containing protein n=2 Tax=Sinorhizobium medicae TaxID=110321 RepID=A0ABX4THC7_9HYPH|nr:transglycosylase SLT domain-containing protein [Sinorhizobium medicae]ABR61053.1 putative transmembrane protein [Sinorhizobium medicae WSM419]MBO1959246.1 transglycosylase SLT domain-containing protein [Sinorhizobium medicae]MDX0405541.1 transglycosylase SLT domain-containing protein [Sinorhizobium medicae]MDX0411061.1 transglycosylase SLT domain-containing protein [Sinorhizobium medicae]MDX0417515.1 transglycosylase SLT domain-containing protein [Sinorhizobium medicae]